MIVSQLCPVNKYLITYQNGTQTCLRCSVCRKGFQAQSMCSYYNDTVCEFCSSGWYSDASGSSCRPCSGCEAGEYLHRYCSSKRNTACRQCPSYTYTTKPNATVCIPCSRCKQNQKMVSKCVAFRDTTCGDCENDHFRLSSSGSCLPCSSCPLTLQYLVVPECRDKRGMHHPDICWPQNTHAQVNSIEETYDMLQTHVNTAPIASSRREEEEQGIRTRNTFLVAALGSVLCFSILITIVFVCLQLQLCNTIAPKSRFSQQPIVATNTELVYTSTYCSINHGIDVDTKLYRAGENIQGTEIDIEYVSDYGSVFTDENMSLKSSEFSINRDSGYPKESVQSYSRSGMYLTNTITTHANQFKEEKENGTGRRNF